MLYAYVLPHVIPNRRAFIHGRSPGTSSIPIIFARHALLAYEVAGQGRNVE